MTDSMEIFQKDYKIYGRHAEYVRALVGTNSSGNKIKSSRIPIFQRYVDVMAVAPIVGFIYKKKGVHDSGADISMLASQMMQISHILTRSYRIIMILDQKEEISAQDRLDRAFKYDRNPMKRKAGDDIFKAYMLGGIEVLYEKLIKDSSTLDEDFMNCIELIDEFDKMSPKKRTKEDIIELCNLAGE